MQTDKVFTLTLAVHFPVSPPLVEYLQEAGVSRCVNTAGYSEKNPLQVRGVDEDYCKMYFYCEAFLSELHPLQSSDQ